ncbi:MAG: hypothetical protein AAB425_15950 [Bdellovibrionota bacterium]
MQILLLLHLLLNFSFSANEIHAPVPINPEFGKTVDTCPRARASLPEIWILKLWDHAVSDDGQLDTGAKRPQTLNQASLYRQLEEWLYLHAPDRKATVITSGCNVSEITDPYPHKIRGWTLGDLQKRVSDPGYDALPAPIALKLKAKHGGQVRAFCADNQEFERQQSVALSGARAALGFYTRLADQNEKKQIRLEYRVRALELYQLPPSTPGKVLLKTLNRELKRNLAEFTRLANTRVDFLFQAISRAGPPESRLLVILPGASAKTLAGKLRRAGFGCQVIEPNGYASESELFLGEIDRWLRGEVD